MKNFSVVQASELEDMQKGAQAVVVDIRDTEDFKQGHWPGAKNIPLFDIEKGDFLLPRHRLVIFYCDHGGVSMQLARELGKAGYRTATVAGGYESMKKIK